MRKLTVVLVVVAFSCVQEMPQRSVAIEPSSSIKSFNGRVVFPNSTEYKKTLLGFSEKSGETLDEWEARYNPHSYRRTVAEKMKTPEGYASIRNQDMLNAPPRIQATLNASAEVQVGDTIIWYNAGTKHLVPNGDEGLLARIKKNPDESLITKVYTITPLVTKGKENHNYIAATSIKPQGSPEAFTIMTSNDWLDARHQYPFYYQDNGNYHKKFVHEIMMYEEPEWACYADGSCWAYGSLAILIKLERYDWYYGWILDFSARYVEWNLTITDLDYCNSEGYCDDPIPPFTLSGTASTDIPIVYVDMPLQFTFIPNGEIGKWHVEVSGYMYQWLYGDYDWNAWMNAQYPLW